MTASFSVEGGRWSHELNELLADHQCPAELHTRPFRTGRRTAFASYPRSGNTYTRSLLERATGFQTSAIYCDRSLETFFAGECDGQSSFFVKTHYPVFDMGLGAPERWHGYDQVVNVGA